MKPEEAISILKSWRITGDKAHEAFDMSIDALEKRIPKETIKPASPYFRYACPSCGNYPLSGNYCGECGQAIDWTEDK